MGVDAQVPDKEIVEVNPVSQKVSSKDTPREIVEVSPVNEKVSSKDTPSKYLEPSESKP